jgi:hypothetical protein
MPYPEIDPRDHSVDLAALLAESAKRELMRDQLKLRRRYEESLIEFMRGAWPHLGESGRCLINWHHREIADVLEALVENGEGGNVVINQPPRTTKSILLVCFNAWIWAQPSDRWNGLRGPHVKFLGVSYSTSLAERFGTAFRRLILSDWYQTLWGHQVIIRTDQGSRSDFANTAGGKRYSASIVGGILGEGADIQCIDDPQNYGAAESEIRREGTIDAMRLLVNRVTDPRHTVRILVMQRLHCLLPGTMVRTPAGQTPVEALRVGDHVLGSNGWQDVRAVSTMPFRGDAYGVRLFGHPEVCWTTPNHRYLTKRGWQRADDLLAADWVRFPSPEIRAEAIPWEEPRRADPPAAPTGNFQGDEPSITRVELSALVATGISNIAIGQRLGVHRNTIQCYLWLYQIGRIREVNPWLGRAHFGDPMFWRLVGYWLAEGSFLQGRNAPCGVHFTFHMDETEYHSEVEETLARYGMSTTKRIQPEKHVCQIESNTSQLARWLKAHFGSGAKWKVLPEFVLGLPEACRAEVLEGWLRGDGCIRQTGPLKGHRSGVSSSIALIHGMQRLALSLGRRAIVVKAQREERLIRLAGYAVIQRPSWELRLSPVPRREGSMRSKIENGEVWYQVREISTKPYDGIVHDLSTPSEDFVVGNATVHNTNDATAYAIENWSKKTQFICFPMRYDITRPDPRDHRENDGELLWPEIWTDAIVKEQESELQEYGVAGQLQQRPIPRGGGIIKHEWWKTWPDDAEALGLADLRIAYHCPICKWADYVEGDWLTVPCPQCGSDAARFNPFPPFSYRLVSVDTNYGQGEQNSYSAATAWAIWHAKDGSPRVMLTDAWRGRPRLRGDPNARDPALKLGLVEIIYGMAKRRQTDLILIERKTRGTDLYNELERMTREWPFQLGYTDPTHKGSKTLRMEACQGLFVSGLVWAPNLDYAQMVIEEVCAMPYGTFDDLADTCTQGLRFLRDSSMLLTVPEHRIEEVARTAFRGRSFDANEVFGLV